MSPLLYERRRFYRPWDANFELVSEIRNKQLPQRLNPVCDDVNNAAGGRPRRHPLLPGPSKPGINIVNIVD